MEKTRLAVALIGKLNFTQLTEMLNASMNRGLPSCLAAEEPSLNYHTKGIDIATASYTSEVRCRLPFPQVLSLTRRCSRHRSSATSPTRSCVSSLPLLAKVALN